MQILAYQVELIMSPNTVGGSYIIMQLVTNLIPTSSAFGFEVRMTNSEIETDQNKTQRRARPISCLLLKQQQQPSSGILRRKISLARLLPLATPTQQHWVLHWAHATLSAGRLPVSATNEISSRFYVAEFWRSDF